MAVLGLPSGFQCSNWLCTTERVNFILGQFCALNSTFKYNMGQYDKAQAEERNMTKVVSGVRRTILVKLRYCLQGTQA